jgi:hypothetical protein
MDIETISAVKTHYVVGFSGGVTSAWCAGWALRTFPNDQVTLLFHDTKEEDADTYRYLHQMAAALNHPITEQSDGRSVTELFYDEGMIANNRAAFCSRILKVGQFNIWLEKFRAANPDTHVVKIIGFSANEWERVQRAQAMSMRDGYSVRFPLIEEQVTKQQCVDWSQCEIGVPIPAMYHWSDHANCVGCVRGGKAYWLAVREHAPEVFKQRKQLEKEFNATISGRYSLVQIEAEGLKRKVGRREAITIGPCECGG